MYVGRVGLDPELAIVSRKTGMGRSAHLFMPKKKQFKFAASGPNKNGSMLGSEVERDGPAIEIRSLVATACRDNLIPYMAEAMRQTALDLRKYRRNAFELSSTPKFILDATSFKNAPEDVSEFGCQPDFDAYSLSVKAPVCLTNDKRRWTGGHIHVSSMTGNDIKEQAALAIMFDYFVALPMVAILGDKFAEGEAERREFYGQPGSFRFDPQLHKIEFRTLSGRLLLHPLVLGWCIGMTKSFINGAGQNGYQNFVKDKLLPVADLETVYNIIMKHDVGAANDLAPQMFKTLKSYKVNESSLANNMSGGGMGTNNPYFYEKALEVLLLGNDKGHTFSDSLIESWGLYEDYVPVHHKYWGIQSAMVGALDDMIFPQNKVLADVWPKNLIGKTPIYTHPENGGAKEWIMKGAGGWLQ